MKKNELIERIKKYNVVKVQRKKLIMTLSFFARVFLILKLQTIFFYDNLTAEEIAEKILTYQPIKL